MSGTLRTLLTARAAAVIGRQAERAVLLGLAERDRPLVVAVHGIAGIGKSALLAAFAEDARTHGAAAVSLDCSGIEPTERGFLAALGRAIGALRAKPPSGTRPMAAVAEAAAALSIALQRDEGSAASPERVCIDAARRRKSGSSAKGRSGRPPGAAAAYRGGVRARG
jgi:AAA ATPase domain